MADKVLFVTLDLFQPFPRTIRCKQIVQHLSHLGIYEIHVLNVGKRDAHTHDLEIAKIVNVPSRFLGRLKNIAFDDTLGSNKKTSIGLKVLKRIVQLGKKLSIRTLFFPDIYIIELCRLKVYLTRILKQSDYRIIIYLIFPFTFYSLGKLVKKYSTKSALVYDIGDPLYGNGTLDQGLLKRYFAKLYEKSALEYCDALIVTNSKTREHFLSTYPNQLANKNVFIIPQGTIVPQNLPKPNSHKLTDLRKSSRLSLVYAGTFYENLRDPKELFGAINSLGQNEALLEIFGVNSRKFISDEMLSGKGAIRFKGMIGNDELQKNYQNYDALVYVDNAYGVQISSKLFELIAAKKPILFIYKNDNSPALEMIKNYGGVVLARNEKEAIKTAIQKIRMDYHFFCYEYDISSFTWKTRAHEYSKALRLLTA